MFFLRKITRGAALAFATMCLSTCAGKVEGPADCPIDCSNAINAVSNTVITPLIPSVTVNCQGSTVPKVVELLFTIEAPSGESEVNPTTTTGAISRPSISFRPVFNGSYDPSKTSLPNQEPQYKGIQTPKNQWCSSTCGVARIDVWPQCEEGTTLTHTMMVISGPIASPPINISMVDTTEEG